MGLRLRAVRCPLALDERLENGRGSGDRAQYDRQVALPDHRPDDWVQCLRLWKRHVYERWRRMWFSAG
jgi:hypothetical protein